MEGGREEGRECWGVTLGAALPDNSELPQRLSSPPCHVISFPLLSYSKLSSTPGQGSPDLAILLQESNSMFYSKVSEMTVWDT